MRITDNYIKKEDLIVGAEYICDGRGLHVGTWNGKRFDYMRYKWGHTFPDTQLHWDEGPPHGTVKPLILRNQERIYVDMDGVLCNFLGAAGKIIGKDLKDHHDWEAVRETAWVEINKIGSDYWANLEWTTGGPALWSHLVSLNRELVILSAYPAIVGNRDFAEEGKRAWLEEHVGKEYADTAIICHVIEKQLYADKGCIIIDDNKKTIDQWNDHGGIGIHYVGLHQALEQLKEVLDDGKQRE